MNSAFCRGLLLGLLLVRGGWECRAARGDGAGGYLDTADWARANGLEISWVKRDESAQLRNSRCRIVLTADSRQCQFNATRVWLLLPVLAKHGGLTLSQLDAQTTLRPLLDPPANRAGPGLKTICLDPGHGGKDPGYDRGPQTEKKATLLLAKELRDQLQRAGFKVYLTRGWDKTLELESRPDLARRVKADLFISLHYNAAETSPSSVKGSQVFCLTPAGASSTNARGGGADSGWCTGNRNNEKNIWLAYCLQRALVSALGTEDLGVRRARFVVLRDAAMPAALVEAGFLSHPVEGKKIAGDTYRREIARAIVEGVLSYKRGFSSRS